MGVGVSLEIMNLLISGFLHEQYCLLLRYNIIFYKTSYLFIYIYEKHEISNEFHLAKLESYLIMLIVII